MIKQFLIEYQHIIAAESVDTETELTHCAKTMNEARTARSIKKAKVKT